MFPMSVLLLESSMQMPYSLLDAVLLVRLLLLEDSKRAMSVVRRIVASECVIARILQADATVTVVRCSIVSDGVVARIIQVDAVAVARYVVASDAIVVVERPQADATVVRIHSVIREYVVS